MHYQELTRISLGLWSIAAITTIFSNKSPTADPVLRLVIPAAITTSLVAVTARVAVAQEQLATEVRATGKDSAGEISGHLDRLATQVTEIARSDQSRLSFLRGLLAAHQCPGVDGMPAELNNN